MPVAKFRDDRIDPSGANVCGMTKTAWRHSDVDMTPMVDVTFLLLIFFMVTASFSLQKSIAMPRPVSEAAGRATDPDVAQVEVEIDASGSFLVTTANWMLETPGKQRLVAALKDAVNDSNGDLRLNIQVHETAKLRSLVDAMDAGTSAGFSKLRVSQVEEF